MSGICKDRCEAFCAAGKAGKIKKVFNPEETQKRYDKGELDSKVN
jgi:fructose-bisphosphate aldolase class II